MIVEPFGAFAPLPAAEDIDGRRLHTERRVHRDDRLLARDPGDGDRVELVGGGDRRGRGDGHRRGARGDERENDQEATHESAPFVGGSAPRYRRV